MSDCQRYIGQLMWLATRTRPDISAVLGICASMMVRTPKAVAAHLVDLWRFVWSTLSPEKGLAVDCLADLRGDSHGSKIASRICRGGQSAKEEQRLLRSRVFTFILILMPVLRQAKEGADQAT